MVDYTDKQIAAAKFLAIKAGHNDPDEIVATTKVDSEGINLEMPIWHSFIDDNSINDVNKNDLLDMVDSLDIDVEKTVDEHAKTMPIDLSNQAMPLEVSIRVMALQIAQKHHGDTVIREGNMYSVLKMEGQKIVQLSPEMVLNTAILFEHYLWGKWSRGIVKDASSRALSEFDEALEEKLGKEE